MNVLAKIIVQEGQSIEDAIKKFNSTVRRAGTLKEVRKHKHYAKPGVRKREKIKENKRNKATQY